MPPANRRHSRRSFRLRPWSRLAGLLPALAFPSLATAQLDLRTTAAVSYEENSNVLEVSSREEALELNGSERRGDTIHKQNGGLQLEYTFGQQKLRAAGDITRFNHDRFTHLDRNEHRLTGGFSWRLSRIVDGSVDVSQGKHLARLSDLDTTELVEQEDRSEMASVNVTVSPTWRVESMYRRYQSELPLREHPEFRLDEDAILVGVKYLGIAQITAGIETEFTDGEFSNHPDARSFKEYSVEATADYLVSGATTFTLELGAVQRDERRPGGPTDSVTGFIGTLEYERVHSPKTTLNAELYRRIDTYMAGGAATIDTGIGAGIEWQATPRIGLIASLAYVRSDFQNDYQDQVGEETRLDRGEDFRFALQYEILRWLFVRTYAEYRDRDSNYEEVGYNTGITGVELRAVID